MARIGARASLALLAIALSWTGAAPAARFEDYPVPVYHSPRHAPDFSGPGRAWRSYRTVIRGEFAQGQGFAGPYVLFAIGCGAGCRNILMGDLRTGRIRPFPISGEDYLGPEFVTRPDSRLVRVHWDTQVSSPSCISEELVFTGASFTRHRTGTRPGSCTGF